MIGLSEAVRAELRGTGVEVTVVMPGFAKTELASGVPDLRVRQARHARGDRRADDRRAQGPALRRLGAQAPRGGHHGSAPIMPRTWREAVSRAMNSNRVVATDPRARAAYEARAAASAPRPPTKSCVEAKSAAARRRWRGRVRCALRASQSAMSRADLRAAVLLEEVAGALDQPRRRAAERARERLARRRRQRAVLGAPQHQQRPRVAAQRAQDVAARASRPGRRG